MSTTPRPPCASPLAALALGLAVLTATPAAPPPVGALAAWAQPGTATAADGAEAAALRTRLAAAERRLTELEAARAEDEATIAALRAELATARATIERLTEEVETSWLWIEELNATLAAARVDPGPAERERAAEAAPPAAVETRTAAGLARLLGVRPGAGTEAAAAPEPERTEGAPQVAVAAQPVHLRAGPGNAAEVRTVVGAGEAVRVLGRADGWRRVAYTDARGRAFAGWIYGTYLRPAAEAEAAAGADDGS